MNKKIPLAIIFSILLVLSMIPYVITVKASDDTLYWVDGDFDVKYGKPTSCKAQGDYLYMSGQIGQTFTIFDISDRNDPVEVGFTLVSKKLREGSVSSDGNYFYVSTEEHILPPGTEGGIMIINCTDKTNPVEMGFLNPLSTAHIEGVWYVESIDVCFLADYDNDCIHSVDVSDKNNPTLISTCYGGGDKVHGIWANETVAVTVSYGGDTFCTYDVSNPSAMTLTQSIGIGANPAQVCGTDNPIIYATSISASSFYIYDISNPASIQTISSTAFGKWGQTAIPDTTNSSVLYVQGENHGNYYTNVFAYDISNPASPSLIDSIGSSNASYAQGTATSMSAIGNNIYVACQESPGITTFRFGDAPPPGEPEDPVDTSEYRMTGISGQENNTRLSTPNVYITGTKGTSENQYYNIQIANTSLFTNPFFNFADINSVNYPAYLTENTTHFNFTIPHGIEYYGAGHGTHYYRYRVRYKTVSE